MITIRTTLAGLQLVQGALRMKDQEGLPIDMQKDLADSQGWQIDWPEALADALRQDVQKYDALVAELRLLEPKAEEFLSTFSTLLMSIRGGSTATEKAAILHQQLTA